MRQASGLITEEGGVESHAAAFGLKQGIPVLCGVENATHILKSGTIVSLDATRGMVYTGLPSWATEE